MQLEKTLDKAALEQYLTGGFNIEAIETQVSVSCLGASPPALPHPCPPSTAQHVDAA